MFTSLFGFKVSFLRIFFLIYRETEKQFLYRKIRVAERSVKISRTKRRITKFFTLLWL